MLAFEWDLCVFVCACVCACSFIFMVICLCVCVCESLHTEDVLICVLSHPSHIISVK